MEIENRERQENELEVLESIFDDERLFVRSSEGLGGQLSVNINIPEELMIGYSLINKREM